MLEDKLGVYAIKLFNKDTNKDLRIIGPQMI
jgi:hypothetical protein